jgi:cytochrome c biogenesis protein CcmG, thiol:disulfide interchange protein DsbE
MSRAGSKSRGGQRPAARARRPRVWVPLAAVAIVVTLFAGLLATGLGRDPTAISSPLIGRTAPGFQLRTLDGKRMVRLGDLRGQVVVVNFWASWCTECRVEHPALDATWQRFRDSGVVIVGVGFQDTRSDALAYLKSAGVTWPAVEDPGSRTALAYGVYGIPETFFIGTDGEIAAKQVGPVSYDKVVAEVTRLLPRGAQ